MSPKSKLLVVLLLLPLAIFLVSIGQEIFHLWQDGSEERNSINFAKINKIQGRWLDGAKIQLPLENRTGGGVSMTIREENSTSHGIVYNAESQARIARGTAPQWEAQAATRVATVLEHSEDRIWFVVPIAVWENANGAYQRGYYAALFSYDRRGQVRFHDAELMTGPKGIPMSVLNEGEGTASYKVGVGSGTPTFSKVTVERRGEELTIATDY